MRVHEDRPAAAAHGATHAGTVRRQNEDAMLIDPALGLFVVADGMGGQNAGEVAARLAIDAVQGFLQRSSQDADHTWPFGIESSLDYDGNRLRTAVKLANRRVFRESESREQYTGMGTTLAVLLVTAGSAELCGVGDTRIYRIRGGGAEQLTRDHTWVETLVEQNPGLDTVQLASHPMRHVLTAVIGAQDDLDVNVAAHETRAGDRFVICTDGVHGPLDAAAIAAIAGTGDVRSAADRLVREALAADGTDNLTAVVVAVTP